MIGPHKFLDFIMSFDSRWQFSVISGKRTGFHNTEIGGHQDSFHLYWLAVDCQFDLIPTEEDMMAQKDYCRRQGIKIFYKDDRRFFHLEPAT